MRVRTAKVTVKKASALETLFKYAADRRLAWLIGDGRVYADLEKVAKKHGYRVWETKEKEDGVFAAVREDLIVEDSWDADEANLSFEATREGLGTVSLVGESLFDNRTSVKVLSTVSNVEQDDLDYTETLYSAEPLKS